MPVPLLPGLFLVATPIGTARDITLRALDVLAAADILAAEDTRNTRRLLDIHAIAPGARKIVAYHDHNGAAQRPKLLAAIAAGQSVAYVSDAGTPMVSDPGYTLARAVIDAGMMVTAVPGASAMLAALTVGGLPTDQFFFAGFLPTRTGARVRFLNELKDVPGTLVFYENPKRVGKSLMNMVEVLGGDRKVALCRELTKKFEDVRRGTLTDLARDYATQVPKGEIVVLVGAGRKTVASDADIETALRLLLAQGAHTKDAARDVAVTLEVSRRRVYALALSIKD